MKGLSLAQGPAQGTHSIRAGRQGSVGGGASPGPLPQLYTEGAGSHAWCEAEFCGRGRGVDTSLALGSSPQRLVRPALVREN